MPSLFRLRVVINVYPPSLRRQPSAMLISSRVSIMRSQFSVASIQCRTALAIVYGGLPGSSLTHLVEAAIEAKLTRRRAWSTAKSKTCTQSLRRQANSRAIWVSSIPPKPCSATLWGYFFGAVSESLQGNSLRRTSRPMNYEVWISFISKRETGGDRRLWDTSRRLSKGIFVSDGRWIESINKIPCTYRHLESLHVQLLRSALISKNVVTLNNSCYAYLIDTGQ